MHKILLKNVNAVLSDRVLDHACVLVQGCRIQEVTDQDLTDRYPEAQIVDGEGGYLLPGFIDIHSDNIETVIQPRPQSMIDFELAIDPVRQSAVQFGQAEKQFLPTPASTETSECSRSWLKRNSGASKSGIPSTAQNLLTTV